MGETRTRVVEGREAKLVGAKVESKAASSIRRKFRKEGEAAHGKEKSGGGGGGVWSTGRNSKCVCVLRKVLRNPPVSSSPTQFPSNLLVGSEPRTWPWKQKVGGDQSTVQPFFPSLSLFSFLPPMPSARFRMTKKLEKQVSRTRNRNPFLPKPSGHPKKSSGVQPHLLPLSLFFRFCLQGQVRVQNDEKVGETGFENRRSMSSSPTQFPSNLLVGSERALGLGSKKWETLLSREGVSRTPVSRRCLSKTESSAATTTSCSTRPTPTSLTAISGSSSSFPASHEAGRGSPTLCMPMSPTIATGTSTTSRSNPSDPPLESERVPHMQTFQLSA